MKSPYDMTDEEILGHYIGREEIIDCKIVEDALKESLIDIMDLWGEPNEQTADKITALAEFIRNYDFILERAWEVKNKYIKK